jgi:hypothetical protein
MPPMRAALQKKPTPPAKARRARPEPVQAAPPPANRTSLPNGLKRGIERLTGVALDAHAQGAAASPGHPVAAAGPVQLKRHKNRIFSNKDKMSLGEFHRWADEDTKRQKALTDHEQANPRFLDTLKTEDDTTGWSKGDPDLAASHHKFPKSALLWFHRHSSPDDQEKTRQALHLSADSGAMALTRLRSNLISPKYGKLRVTSDRRTDDPHNNQQAARRGEEGLDLVHQSDGSMTPRSRQYSDLRRVMTGVHKRLTEEVNKGSDIREKSQIKKGFRLSPDEAHAVRTKLETAERLHYAIESKPKLPSHSSGDVWRQNGPSFSKQPVAPIRARPMPRQQFTKVKEKEARERAVELELEESRRKNRHPRWGAYAYAGKSERLSW